MATDLKIDTSPGGTWDLVVTDGEFEIVEAEDEVAQRVAVATKTHLGEWTFDTDLGLPWIGEILVRDPNIPRIRNRFSALWSGIAGVDKVLSLGLEFDESARELTVTGSIRTVFGDANLVITL
jgi:hypothetical protein